MPDNREITPSDRLTFYAGAVLFLGVLVLFWR
ncbi:hypothetical protein Mnod_6487 [Methylobacterium nodulans ORS 2060]|uniref:Uncharacterized protein n=1 Tax=Methylobacterium nodulans (strain LMG 21967 / CNCM I-2342 / ORS 2060) TaxID=460265 RepID=B8IAK9_METNO|nr:hypothetical protein Mnod_6248 [Methylobacterium nodulans ORS 2060]ACL61258.1 hypothetical protein Mnod_6487 [Methylobacterium nodulans ORS 2060]